MTQTNFESISERLDAISLSMKSALERLNENANVKALKNELTNVSGNITDANEFLETAKDEAETAKEEADNAESSASNAMRSAESSLDDIQSAIDSLEEAYETQRMLNRRVELIDSEIVVVSELVSSAMSAIWDVKGSLPKVGTTDVRTAIIDIFSGALAGYDLEIVEKTPLPQIKKHVPPPPDNDILPSDTAAKESNNNEDTP